MQTMILWALNCNKNINSIVNISINIVYTSKKSVGGLIFNILNGKSL